MSAQTERQSRIALRQSRVLLPHIASALHNALEHTGEPVISQLRRLARHCRGDRASWRRRVVYVAIAIAVTTFLTLFPVRLQVYGRGSLQPTVQRDIFAEVDGIVRTVHVEHGDYVQAGAVLAELHNSDLEVQVSELLGRERAASEQLAGLQRQRHDPNTPPADRNHLASTTIQLHEELHALNEQIALLHAKRERLTIRSPIAGQVVTWNVSKTLAQRPISLGQVLLTIADPQSPRELELFLPEADIAHLSAASTSTPRELTVDYCAVTDPTREHRGMLRQVDARAQLHEEHEHCVRLLVDVDPGDAPAAPAGTSVTARIDCGRKSIGYVWLHRFVGFVYSKILFRIG